MRRLSGLQIILTILIELVDRIPFKLAAIIEKKR